MEEVKEVETMQEEPTLTEEAVAEAIESEPIEAMPVEGVLAPEPEDFDIRPGRFRFGMETVSNGLAMYLYVDDVSRPQADYVYFVETPSATRHQVGTKPASPTFVMTQNDLRGLVENLAAQIAQFDSEWVPTIYASKFEVDSQEDAQEAIAAVSALAIAEDRGKIIELLVNKLAGRQVSIPDVLGEEEEDADV